MTGGLAGLEPLFDGFLLFAKVGLSTMFATELMLNIPYLSRNVNPIGWLFLVFEVEA